LVASSERDKFFGRLAVTRHPDVRGPANPNLWDILMDFPDMDPIHWLRCKPRRAPRRWAHDGVWPTPW